MATASPDHNHQRQTLDENGEIVTQQIDPGESAPSEPMPKWAWEEETPTEEAPASEDDAGAPSTDAG